MRLVSEVWSAHDVIPASSFWLRWRGLQALPDDSVLLLRARAIHSFGMPRPFLAVGLDASFAVLEVRHLAPGQLARFKGARYVLEMSASSVPPPIGTILEVFGD